MQASENNIVAVIGAGPVGLAAAAHLLKRGLQPLVLEKGKSAGHAMRSWGHVQVFTPWKYVTDKALVALLESSGWQHPDKEHLPTGSEIVDAYLIPAATTTPLQHYITYDAEVVSVSKRGLSKSSSNGRAQALYTVHYQTPDGHAHVLHARAVIDASGTWYNPNPIGTDGLPVAGEKSNADTIAYGIPNILAEKATYAGKRTLVLGGGHSAINAVLDLLEIQNENPETKIYWGLRRNNIARLLGGGLNDELPARGALGIAARKAIEDGALELLAPFSVETLHKTATGLHINGKTGDGHTQLEVDRIVVATGFRPNLQMLRELRLDLDDTVEAPSTLAPLIDPNLHSCGTVPPHGVDELSHPDKNFFIVGMKAYGRAPTFLMLTGYEQVRSIADELAGNHEAARQIELILPETGVCNTDQVVTASSVAAEPVLQPVASACCGPAAKDTAAPEGTVLENALPALATADVALAPTPAETTSSSCCTPNLQPANKATVPCCGDTESEAKQIGKKTGCC